jgi:hypothetical protein
MTPLIGTAAPRDNNNEYSAVTYAFPMTIDGVEQTRAQHALALISRDTVAREIFITAYAGHGDALDLLSRAATDVPPAPSETLRELRRQAFGRTHTPAEENAARAALTAISDAKAVQAADSRALRAAIVTTEEWATSKTSPQAIDNTGALPRPGASTSAGPAPEPHRFMFRPLVLASLVVASMAIGALIVTLWTNPVGGGAAADYSPASSAGATHTVKNVAQGTDSVDYGTIKSTGQGNHMAAAQWFLRAATPSDIFPSAALIDGLTASSTRLVGGTPRKIKIWVGKTHDDRVCLIMTAPSAQGALESINSCANAQQFDAMGLGLHAGGYQAIWMGQTVSVFSDLTRATTQ